MYILEPYTDVHITSDLYFEHDKDSLDTLNVVKILLDLSIANLMK